MTPNISLSEILLIAVVVLIVFGPHRLPEMARKAGEMVARLRKASEAIRSEFTNEYSDLAEPLADIERDLRAAKDNIKSSLPKLDNDSMGAGGAGGESSGPKGSAPPRPPTGDEPAGTGAPQNGEGSSGDDRSRSASTESTPTEQGDQPDIAPSPPGDETGS